MATTISKRIGEGFASGQIYAALAYDSSDRYGGYEIKSMMTNSNYKHYFRDSSQYIYSSALSTLDIVAATVAVTGDLTVSGTITYGSTVVPTATGYMGTLTVGVDGTGYDVTFYGDTSNYYWKWDQDGDTNGGMVLVGTATITGATTITGAVAITGALTQTGNVAIVGTLNVGADGAGTDFALFGDVAKYGVTWDANGDTNGALYVGADKHGVMFNLYGDVTGCGVFWNPSTDTNGTLTIGATGGSAGVDVVMYGDTSGKYWKWDQSADGVVLVGTETITGNVAITGAVGIVGAVTVGVDNTGHDVKFYGATSGSYLMWDESDDRLELDGADLNLQDSDILQFGDAQDVSMRWDGTDFDILAAADGSIIKFGNGTKDFDIWIYGGSNTVKFDEGASIAYFDGYDIQLQDGDFLNFGDAANGDITMNFDGTNFEIEGAAAATTVLWGNTTKLLNTTWMGTLTVGADTDGHDVKFFGNTTGAYCLWDESDDRLALVKAGIDIGVTDYSIDFGTPSTAVFKYVDDGTIVSVTNGSILNDIHGTANAGFIKVIIGASTVRYIALYEAKA